MFKVIKNGLIRLISYESSAHKLAIASSVGVYIAFCPYIGFHTIMIFASAWLFKLNLPVVLGVSYGVNNPWTAVPVYAADYLFGHWLIHKILKFEATNINPWWMHKVNAFLYHHIGIQGISFWAFMIGGNLLGIITAFICYPVIKYLFIRFGAKRCSV